jgi:hypothetical protein
VAWSLTVLDEQAMPLADCVIIQNKAKVICSQFQPASRSTSALARRADRPAADLSRAKAIRLDRSPEDKRQPKSCNQDAS